mgnify:CR=1 FL=1
MNDQTAQFIVTGLPRSGSTLLALSLNLHPQIFCAGELLLDSQCPKVLALASQTRRIRKRDGDGSSAAWDWLQRRLFTEENFKAHAAVGFKLLYAQMERQQLFPDLQRGRFKVIHLWRNPVMSSVSLMQAKRDGIWHKQIGAEVCPDQ